MPRLIPRSLIKYPSLLFVFLLIGFLIGFLVQWTSSINFCLRKSPSVSSIFYEHFPYRTRSSCRHASEARFLTIAVLSSHDRLIDYLPAMLETWMTTATREIEMIIFLEETGSTNVSKFLDRTFDEINRNSSIFGCLYIVQLKHVMNEYPPQKKSFHAMKFLWTYYRHRTSWILRLDDNAYPHLPRLILWLKSIDHRQTLYIGQGGTGRRNGPAIHFPPGQYFCMGGSGVILSQQTLMRLGPWLKQCLTSETRTPHEDVELGRCISKHVQISCSRAYDSKHLFYHHYGPTYEFAGDFTPTILSRAMILHPVKSRRTFRQIFAFYLWEKIKPQFSPSTVTVPKEGTWVTFLPSMEFDLVRDIHYQRIDIRWKTYIEQSVQSYIERFQQISHQRGTNWTVTRGQPMFGYHRVNPGRSLQLLVEVLLHIRSNRSTLVRKRLNFYQPLFSRNHLFFREILLAEPTKPLHLVIVAKDKDQALKRFLQIYQREILNVSSRRDLFTLNLLYFPSKNNLLHSLNQYAVRYPSHFRISIWNRTETIYNRGLGRQLASASFADDALLLFLDIDLLFTGQALLNIRQWMLDQSGKTSSCFVFFPIIYSIYSTRNSSTAIDRRNGLFSIYGFGNVALRKSDLERFGGWETTNHYWGSEDVHLFEKFVNRSMNCDVFRTVEPGLRHVYHQKRCAEIPDRGRKAMCREAEANLRASQWDLVSSVNELL